MLVVIVVRRSSFEARRSPLVIKIEFGIQIQIVTLFEIARNRNRNPTDFPASLLLEQGETLAPSPISPSVCVNPCRNRDRVGGAWDS